ncbi:MAG TPA: SUMF1/EgtB/PvdO family nonheme iron enzyme, partial [Ktedonobacterales bacterium]|nr:SUMF1/EgtB/PvdO family nonheme iron enzyme [Ktedonobacterales bacterium]
AHGGDTLWRKIVQEITDRPIFIIVASSRSLASPWVMNEINIAWTLKNTRPNRHIIPVLYEACDLPADLLMQLYISFLPPQTFEAGLASLVTAIHALAGTRPTPPPAAPVGASGGRPPAPLASSAPAEDPATARVRQATPLIEAAFVARDWPQVLDRCRYLAAVAPNAADAMPARLWLLYGQASLEDGETQEGRAALERALQQTPDDLETLRAAAHACHTLGDDSAAETHLLRALGRPVPMATDEQLAVLRDYLPVLLALKKWNEALRRATQGSRLAPDSPVWLRWQVEALDHLNRPADALAVLRTLTARPDATARDWLARARLARTVEGETEAANAEARSALDAAARLAGPNDATVAAARRELFPPPAPPIAPEYFPDRLASLGFVPRKGRDPQTGKEAAFILPPTVPVPAGPFQMGKVNPNDPDGQYDGPARTVDVPAFAIARYPVTVAEYACFVRAGQREPSEWQDQLKQTLDHPVVSVSWHDATAYAEWLARLSGQPWRLPSEEEWEKAARWDPRTGTSFVYPWGDTFEAARCNTRESGEGTTTPVGKYGAAGASPCGAEEMAGNVWEWTSLPYDSSTDNRVLRGGSWDSVRQIARAAVRVHNRSDNLNDNDGFRLASAPGRAGS